MVAEKPRPLNSGFATQCEDGFPDPSRRPTPKIRRRQGAMADSAKLRITSDRPLGKNPCPPGSAAHQRFEDVSELTRTNLARFVSHMLSIKPATGAPPEQKEKWKVDFAAGQFSIKAS